MSTAIDDLMKRLLGPHILLAALCVVSCSTPRLPSEQLGAASPSATFRSPHAVPGVQHVHLMHLDGFHGEIFHQLLEAGMLPHFALLLRRGKISYVASTVDKSETFKVIESYLTSRRDTEVAAWWHFSRDRFGFRNYWIDPVEVVNYALGLEFPLSPTVFDVVVAHGGNVASGFGLHRRGVPFNNYSRNYVEGAVAAFKHTYFTQAHATMTGLLGIYERIARSDREQLPAFTMSLLGVADEYGHLEGIVRPRALGGTATACFARARGAARKADVHDVLFQILDEEDHEAGGIRDQNTGGHFTRVDKDAHGIRRVCIHVPTFETAVWPAGSSASTIGKASSERAAPDYVLGMILVDIELGRLMNTLRAIRVDSAARHFFDARVARGYSPKAPAQAQDESLFDHTLFVLMGDHGMVDTPCMMTPPDMAHPDPRRHPGSLNVSFIEYLNRQLGLVTATKTDPIAAGVEIGIDDTQLPAPLAFPHKDPSWQSPTLQRHVSDAEQWAREFFDDIKDAVRGDLYAQYWWLFFLRQLLVDPNLEKSLSPYRHRAVDILTQVYLKGDPDYAVAEHAALRSFYDAHVRLVYGGGARNNAELFLPTWRGGTPSWARRPSVEEILHGPAAPVIEAVKRNPGVGLIFIRKANAAIAPDTPLPDRLEILVTDRMGNSGTITVKKDPQTKILLFGYRVAPDSAADPLGYGELGRGDGTWGTYNEWNDLSVQQAHYYHNVVAGMGAYLYSANTSIGDITLMHSQGWNFGDNAGGHGGVHREEKLSVMLVSGPGIRAGELMASAGYASRDGTVRKGSFETHPTVLDVAPTILAALGYGDDALSNFARNGFAQHLNGWIAAQRDDILGNLDNVENLNQALRQAGFSDLRISRFRNRLARLLAFLPQAPPQLPDYSAFHEDGNLLKLDE